jgi:hypothetical protein
MSDEVGSPNDEKRRGIAIILNDFTDAQWPRLWIVFALFDAVVVHFG